MIEINSSKKFDVELLWLRKNGAEMIEAPREDFGCSGGVNNSYIHVHGHVASRDFPPEERDIYVKLQKIG